MGRWNGPDYVQKRPDRDSVPLIDCGHRWCGHHAEEGVRAPVRVRLGHSSPVVAFCSPGCASRWLIRYELRGHGPEAPAVPTPAQVRSWAHDQGIAIGDRGRVPESLVTRYVEAHP